MPLKLSIALDQTPISKIIHLTVIAQPPVVMLLFTIQADQTMEHTRPSPSARFRRFRHCHLLTAVTSPIARIKLDHPGLWFLLQAGVIPNLATRMTTPHHYYWNWQTSVNWPTELPGPDTSLGFSTESSASGFNVTLLRRTWAFYPRTLHSCLGDWASWFYFSDQITLRQ